MNWYKTKKYTEPLGKKIISKRLDLQLVKKRKTFQKLAYTSKSHKTNFAKQSLGDGCFADIELTESKNSVLIAVRLLTKVYSFPLLEETWNYDKKEMKRAIKTYNRIINVLEDLKLEVEDDETPTPTIQGLAREELRYVDIDRKKPTNNVSLEASKQETGSGDWRQNIYGNRYPKHTIEITNNGTININNS